MFKLESFPIIDVGVACSEKGCVLPASFEVYDMWGSQPMCTRHKDFLSLGKSTEDRTDPFPVEMQDRGERIAYAGASSVDKDWFQTPSLPWERIPEYLSGEIKNLCLLGIPTREIARIIGYDRRQVRRFIGKNFLEVLDAPCQCGKSRRHQGWCRVRFDSSEVRQSVMRLMQIKRYAQSLRELRYDLKAVSEMVAERYPDGYSPKKGTLPASMTKAFAPTAPHLSKVESVRHSYSHAPARKEAPTSFEESALSGYVDDGVFESRKQWGEKSSRAWRESGAGVQRDPRLREKRGGVNKKRGNL